MLPAISRFRDAQADGSPRREQSRNLAAHPMSPSEAAQLICSVHTRRAEQRKHGFAIDWSAPNFVEVDGDLYWEAWRVLRELGGVTE